MITLQKLQSAICLSILCFLCSILHINVFPFVHFGLVLVLYVLLWFLASDYLNDILKPFFRVIHVIRSLVFCVIFCRLLFILFRLTIALYFSNISVISWRGIISKGLFARGRGFYCYSIKCGILWTFSFYHGPLRTSL